MREYTYFQETNFAPSWRLSTNFIGSTGLTYSGYKTLMTFCAKLMQEIFWCIIVDIFLFMGRFSVNMTCRILREMSHYLVRTFLYCIAD